MSAIESKLEALGLVAGARHEAPSLTRQAASDRAIDADLRGPRRQAWAALVLDPDLTESNSIDLFPIFTRRQDWHVLTAIRVSSSWVHHQESAVRIVISTSQATGSRKM